MFLVHEIQKIRSYVSLRYLPYICLGLPAGAVVISCFVEMPEGHLIPTQIAARLGAKKSLSTPPASPLPPSQCTTLPALVVRCSM